MLVEVIFGDSAKNVPHNHRIVPVEKRWLIGPHHKQPLAAIVLLIPQQQQVQVGCVGRPDERGDRPLGALLLPQEIHRLDRGKLLKVRRQVLLRAGRVDIFHVEQIVAVHGSLI